MSADDHGRHPEHRYLDLLRRGGSRIERIVRAWTRSAADAEELRSEIHLQLWRSLPSFDDRSAEETWLYRVALNTAMGFARKRRRRPERLLPPDEMPEETAPAEAPAWIDERALLRKVRHALAELADLDRAIVALWLEDLPYRQIAEVTGLSEGNVGVRLHRARRLLAERLGEEETVHAPT